MIRKASLPILALALVTYASAGRAWAQEEDEPEMTFEEDDLGEEQPEGEPEGEGEPEDEPEPGGDLDTDLSFEGGGDDKPVKGDTGDVKLGESRVSWQDIVVVVRKPFLKVNRLELLPQWSVTMNDNIIQHIAFGGQVNYYLTDVLAVGLEGQYYIKNLREPFDLVARQARRLPTVNKYNWSAALDFHYVPVYGKFAVFDQHIVHWETFFTAGVGITQSEVLPRDPALQPFTNFLVTPNVGAAMRFFITRWTTVHVGIRDYVFVDKFEATDRMEVSGDAARDNADSSLVNNIMFQVGVSFWFPTSFRYTTFR